MNVKELIAKEIESIPDSNLIEVLDFIRFIETKTVDKKVELALASESSLKKDWLSAQENEAWKDL